MNWHGCLLPCYIGKKKDFDLNCVFIEQGLRQDSEAATINELTDQSK